MGTLVKPLATIVDYKTAYNGITENILQGVPTTLVDVQSSLLERVSADDLLVGHSIDDDLRCLHLEHRKVVDTCQVFPHPAGPHKRQSLKFLAKQYINREIQQQKSGHDSKEDALAALDLM